MAGRIKVVFASLLKPVDEPRMYEKLGRSLAQTYKYDVNIIGFASKNLPKDPLVTFWPIFDFKRISLARGLAPLKFFKILLQVKPKLIIASGTDLLMVSVAYKILFGCHIINDLQENYYRNILWSHNTSKLIKRIRAGYVRLQEKLIDRMIIQYLLAELNYKIECSFITKPCLVLENKARKPPGLLHGSLAANFPKEQPPSLKLVYTGTVAYSYGILEALQLADSIHQLAPQTTFTVCGHCPSNTLCEELKTLADTRPWLQLKISTTPIPHPAILQELQEADYSIIAYRRNPANENCRPTRIWEALAWQTPMILRPEHPWVAWVTEHDAGFAIDFINPDPAYLQHMLFSTQYFRRQQPDDIYWESQEKEWLHFMDQLALS